MYPLNGGSRGSKKHTDQLIVIFFFSEKANYIARVFLDSGEKETITIQSMHRMFCHKLRSVLQRCPRIQTFCASTSHASKVNVERKVICHVFKILEAE